MFRKLSKSPAKRSSDSAAQTPHVSYQPSRSSAPIPKTSTYSPRSSAQIHDTSIQAAWNFDQTSGSYTHPSRSSDQRPRISDQSPRYYTHSSLPSTQTPRSSASAPQLFPPHPLSLPSPNIPYDTPAWTFHDAQLACLFTKANGLDTLAHTAELRWKAAEAALPPSRQHEVGVFAKIPVLQDVHVVLRQVRKLGRKEKKWRLQWMPRSPRLKYPAWGSCYAEAVEVYEGEGVSPECAVQMLNNRVEELASIVRGWIEEEIWGREWGIRE